MKIFYETRIAPYSSSNPKKSFCNDLEDIIGDFGDDEDIVTLISMNDDDVFAALLINLNPVDKNIDIYIDLFCGNQALTPTGEGSKLLKILEKASLNTNLFNIELSSVRKSVQYYKNNSYHLTGKNTGSLVNMRKHTRAISNWSKIKNSLGPSDRRYLDNLYSLSKASRAKGLKGKKTKVKKGKKTKVKKGKKNKTKGKNNSSKIKKPEKK